MFIGHFAPAFAAAAASPRAPRLTTLFVAAQLVDLGFFAFALIGVEKMRITPGATAMNPMDLYYMPFTHSMLGSAVWAVIFGLVIIAAYRDVGTGFIAAMVVFSHWILDFLVHRPDLTLAGGNVAYGLGLWNYPLIEIPLELAITIGAFAWYMRRTRGPIGPPVILLAVMLILQAVNWFAPQPTEAGPLLYTQALFAYVVFIALARWVGNNRRHKRAQG